MEDYEALWHRLSEYICEQYVDAQIDARDRMEDEDFDTQNDVQFLQRRTLIGTAFGREFAYNDILERMSDLKFGRK